MGIMVACNRRVQESQSQTLLSSYLMNQPKKTRVFVPGKPLEPSVMFVSIDNQFPKVLIENPIFLFLPLTLFYALLSGKSRTVDAYSLKAHPPSKKGLKINFTQKLFHSFSSATF
jgi:hypothetical protein